MKKIYSFLFAIGFVSAVSAQVEIRDYSGTGGTQIGNDISGTTYSITVDAAGIIIQHFAVKNVSGADQYMRVKRVQLNIPSDWTDALCWGQDPDANFEGGCYTAAQMNSNPWSSPNVTATNHAPTISDQSIADLKLDFDISSVGVAHYRYYIMPNQGSTPIDSIDVEITRTLGIVEEKEAVGMTAYPNPVNNILTVNTTGVDDGSVSLKITDVLGKVVYNDEVGTVKKIDVNDFKNGVYLVSVFDKGNLIQTRRIVVKH